MTLVISTEDFQAILIREATISDVPEMLPLVAQLGYPDVENTLRLRFERFTQKPGCGLAVASVERHIVGWIAWSPSELFVLDSLRVRIEGLIVASEHRGKGVGIKLMEWVEAIAKENSPAIINLRSSAR